MMTGWVKLHRCTLNKAVWQNQNLWRVFSWCLMKASHKEIEQMVGMTKVVLQPGQFIYGRHVASAVCGLSPSTMRNCMNWLKSNQTLDIKSDNKKSVVSVVNWALYQSQEEEVDSKQDNNRTTTGQQQDTNKKVKNKRIKEKSVYGSCKNVFLTQEEYDRLKKEYPLLADTAIEYLSNYIVEKAYITKDHNRTIRRWVIDAVSKKQPANKVDFGMFVEEV